MVIAAFSGRCCQVHLQIRDGLTDPHRFKKAMSHDDLASPGRMNPVVAGHLIGFVIGAIFFGRGDLSDIHWPEQIRERDVFFFCDFDPQVTQGAQVQVVFVQGARRSLHPGRDFSGTTR